MITVCPKDFKSETSQKSYNEAINNLDLNTLECPCCHHHDMKIHGYYKRAVKTPEGIIRLRVMRVRCKSCGRTHAILLSTLVPYQSVQLKDQIRIIRGDDPETVMSDNPYIDESDIARIRYNFNHFFRERLISEHIVTDDSLIKNCFRVFRRQFLQIKCTFNILCS